MTKRVASRVAAGAALLVVALAAFAGTRSAGDPPVAAEGDGISVSAPPLGAAGGGAAPGPDGAPAAPGSVTAAPTGEGAPPPVLQIPNIRLAFSAMLAQAGGANPTFTYRAAVEARDSARYPLAVELFDLVAASTNDLAPFAAFRAAQMTALAADAGETTAAAERYEALLAPGGPAERLPTSLRGIALAEGAAALDADGRDGEALLALEQIDMLDVGTFTRAAALWERARLLEAAGAPGWEDLAVAALTTEPGSVAARDALDLLDAAEAPYPRLVAAFAAYRGFRNDDALARYEALLEEEGTLDDAEAAQAWFYIGALRERAFEREAAIEAYGSSLAADPDGAWADDARYWRGRVLEELGRPEDAVVEYDLLAESFPASTFAEDARLRAAVALGLADRGDESTARLAAITRTASPATAAEAAHWHDVLVALFDAPPADLAPATSYDPTSYAAAFEAGGDAILGPIPTSALDEVPTPIPASRVPIDVWLAARGASRAVDSTVLEHPDVELAWILVDAGEPEVARGLLYSALFARRDQPFELVALAYAAKDRGLHDVALNAANVLLGDVPPAERLAAPRELLALAYPVPFLEETTAAAEEFAVPALLLYALMRQESAFDPTAGSSAGAFGLTQVIYPTGEAIARALGADGWAFEDLAHPRLSTRFGAYYLAVQLEEFDGHMLAALSAYNGGPGNAARWLDAQPFDGPDGYLYAVDFTETRTYLEHVSANYAMYRYLYAGLDAPALPHGE